MIAESRHQFHHQEALDLSTREGRTAYLDDLFEQVTSAVERCMKDTEVESADEATRLQTELGSDYGGYYKNPWVDGRGGHHLNVGLNGGDGTFRIRYEDVEEYD